MKKMFLAFRFNNTFLLTKTVNTPLTSPCLFQGHKHRFKSESQNKDKKFGVSTGFHQSITPVKRERGEKRPQVGVV